MVQDFPKALPSIKHMESITILSPWLDIMYFSEIKSYHPQFGKNNVYF